MSANYWASSQRSKWQVTRQQIKDARKHIEDIEQKEFGNDLSLSQCKYDLNMRIYLHQMIIKLGRRLNLRQVIMSTAEVYLSRFLLKASIKEINIYLLVATCIYVACKIEECPQHIRTVLLEARNCWLEFIPNDITKLAELEFYLIDELDCYMIVYHPYNSLIQLVDVLKTYGNSNSRVNVTPTEFKDSWFIINDSYILDLHLLFPPHIIAISALYIILVLGFSPSTITDEAGTKSQASLETLLESADQNSPSSHQQQLSARQITLKKIGKSAKSIEKKWLSTQKKVFNPRIDTFIKFLGRSSINLGEVIQTIQDLMTLYDSWDYYDEISERNLTHNMLATLNRDHNY